MIPWSAWLQAARPLAQANLATPLLWGQAFAFSLTREISWPMLAAVAVWGVLDQLFIVFSNDFADREHDGDRTLFSGGSGVLQEGKLRPRDLAIGAATAFGLLGVLTFGMALHSSLWLLLLYVAAGALMWAYSFQPLRLSYRGGGEVLQGLGVGVVLPLVGFWAQAPDSAVAWHDLLPTFLLGVAGNITTALPDYESDSSANKRTLAVRVGTQRAMWIAWALSGAAVAGGAMQHSWLAVAAVPLLFVFPRCTSLPANTDRPGRVLHFVIGQGATAQLLLLGWAALLIYAS